MKIVKEEYVCDFCGVNIMLDSTGFMPAGHGLVLHDGTSELKVESVKAESSKTHVCRSCLDAIGKFWNSIQVKKTFDGELKVRQMLGNPHPLPDEVPTKSY